MNDRIESVCAHGAVGDGIADDTAAIQSAMDAASRVSGGAVEIPPGIYACGQLRVPSQIRLFGHAAWSYNADGASILKLNDSNATSLLDCTDSFGATISGLCLNGAGIGQKIHGVCVHRDAYAKVENTLLIENCRITRFSGDGVHLHRAWVFTIRASMIAHNTGHGIWGHGRDGFLSDLWVSGNGGAGFFGEDTFSVAFTACRIEWNRAGGIVGEGMQKFTITGCYFDRCGGPGIALLPHARNGKPCLYGTITGSIVNRNGAPVWGPVSREQSCNLSLLSARGMTCTGNTLRAASGDANEGDSSPIVGILIGDVRESVIAGNTLYGAASEQLIEYRETPDASLIVRDNPGSLFVPEPE